ncbi:MAG: AAA-like domain-containing protein [Bacteroidales bacterium]|nr:AAA-like domain-containing protein [Bacteroidales bacterium]
MARYFNVAGPCNAAEHYMIEASSRLTGVVELISQKQYFVIHAARQSGKTTFLLDLANRLNREGKYYALYCSLEGAQGVIDPEKGIPAIVKRIENALRFSNIPQKVKFAKDADYSDYTGVLLTELTVLSMSLDKPLVILFDEADCLSEGTLISFLRQLRNGYNTRSITPFVHSVALVGMRNIRDYKVQVRPDSETLDSASPFNIVAESLTLKNFTKEEITELYGQHTADTGQVFTTEAIELVYQQTQGQPWLVNAIAREVIEKMLQSDYTKPVTAGLVDKAIQTIILRRDTHIDSLLERLKEERVRRVMEPVITGELEKIDTQSDDYRYTTDLGLIKAAKGVIMPSNPIYAEVIIRTLSANSQKDLAESKYSYQMPRYLKNGRIDMTYLLQDFQSFWSENSEIWIERYQYKEAAPHLILQAFLQRVVNGGGRIIREFAAGRRRLDLCVMFEGQKYPVELKVRYSAKTEENSMEQIIGYMDTLGVKEGWLIIFDRNPNIDWNAKIFLKTETVEGKTVTIAGC